MLQYISPIYLEVLMLFLLTATIFSTILFIVMLKKNDKKNKELRNIQQQYIGKIDSLRKEHAEILNGIRRESLKREEDRNNQWIESERELLNVLNGLSMFFDINEKLNKVESEKILAKLQEIEEKLINNIKSLRLSNNG